MFIALVYIFFFLCKNVYNEINVKIWIDVVIIIYKSYISNLIEKKTNTIIYIYIRNIIFSLMSLY